MRRVVILVALQLLAAPRAGTAQDAPRWSWEVGLGWTSPIEARSAFDGGSSLRLGVTRRLGSDVAIGLSYGRERLPYDDARFGELFETPGEPDATPLGAMVRRLSTGLEWSPAGTGRIHPLLGASVSYEHRGVSGLVTSSASYYCSPGTRFHYGTDPVTGATTITVVNPPPAPGCAALRRDIDIEGGTFTMGTAVGFSFDVGRGAFVALVRYSHGFTYTLPGLMSTHLLWRMPF